MTLKNLPPCSKWGMWYGPEIEGLTDVGEKTLFVRKGDPSKYWGNVERVWFTKENHDFKQIREAIALNKRVCLEVTLDQVNTLPIDIYNHCQLYLKIEAHLKKDDHVCIGTAFKDEAYLIGYGAAVEPNQYLNDQFLE